MNEDKNMSSTPASEDTQVNGQNDNAGEMITLQNPLKPGTSITVSKDAIENEQKYKEALTERD